jgi:hypothetical protein
MTKHLSIALFASLLAACSTTQPRPVASYSSRLNESQVNARQMVPMSDEEANHQKAGTTISRKTASSETVSKRGQIKKHTSTNEEQIETETSTFVDTFSVPTSDKDAHRYILSHGF